jgi:redox-sensitive bicupin YhaK (pirin superfamily)
LAPQLVSLKGTPWHPHRGFETVTYIIDGTFDHQDSHGGGGTITNGDTQWMTAGSGLLHIEAPPESLVMSGGLFHGLRLWVNLPAKDKMMAPALPGHPRRQRPAAHLPRRRRAAPCHRR